MDILASDRIALDVFFRESPSDQLIAKLKSEFPEIEIKIEQEIEKDWLEEWKKGFEPFPLVPNLWVVPPWREPPIDGTQYIWLEPGMAFGTGTHSTTRLCSQILSQVVQAHPGGTVLDVGTGTGVLAMLAVKLGAASADAIDNDPEAMRVVRENLELNQEARVRPLDVGVEDLKGPYDIVVANIIDGVLVKIEEHLLRLVKPSGYLILSGVIDERKELFHRRFIAQGFKWISEHQDQEWFGYVLQRDPWP